MVASVGASGIATAAVSVHEVVQQASALRDAVAPEKSPVIAAPAPAVPPVAVAPVEQKSALPLIVAGGVLLKIITML